ncbi:MAG: hypothetical protein J2P48_03660 [Alphaproteobacteria bacterium]|nr:hypothetical protein [Alphaproteobacteria bacterium]
MAITAFPHTAAGIRANRSTDIDRAAVWGDGHADKLAWKRYSGYVFVGVSITDTAPRGAFPV